MPSGLNNIISPLNLAFFPSLGYHLLVCVGMCWGWGWEGLGDSNYLKRHQVNEKKQFYPIVGLQGKRTVDFDPQSTVQRSHVVPPQCTAVYFAQLPTVALRCT